MCADAGRIVHLSRLFHRFFDAVFICPAAFGVSKHAQIKAAYRVDPPISNTDARGGDSNSRFFTSFPIFSALVVPLENVLFFRP